MSDPPSPSDAERAVAGEISLAVVAGFLLFFAFSAVSLIARPIPAEIYPTFAFRPEDGALSIAAFLAVNAAWVAVLGCLPLAGVLLLERRGRTWAAVVAATVCQVALLAGSVVGGTGDFVSSYRWLLAAVLVGGSAAGFAALRSIWIRVPDGRRVAVAGFALGAIVAVDYVMVTALGHFAKLYGAVFVWLAVWSQVLLWLLLAEIRDDLGLRAKVTRVTRGVAVAVVLLATVDASGAANQASLHIRRVYDWRCPEAAALVNLSRTAKLDFFKLRSAVRSSEGGAAIDRELLASVGPPQRKLHVVVFVIDALRRDRIGIFNEKVKTPHIDAIADEAIVYSNAFSPAPTTGYSIVSYLSGMLPEAAVQAEGPPLFLPFVLREHGWETGASSSFDGLHDMVPVLAGFDSDDIGFSEVSDVGIDTFAPGYDARVVDALSDRLTDPGDVRFEYIHLFGTHGPFRPPDSVANYDAAVRAADEQLGRLVTRLRDNGEWKRTVLVVMGDHGEGLGEHGMYAHSQSLYVEQTAVPLIVRIPGTAAQLREGAVTLDILPGVVMKALGGSWPIEAERDVAVQEFHIRSQLVWRAMRRRPWSYHHRILDGTTELYNLDDDPGEARNVAEKHPDIVEDFRAREEQLVAELE